MISKLEQFPTTLSSLHISLSASCNLLDSSLKGGGGLLTCPYPLNFEAIFGLGAGGKGQNVKRSKAKGKGLMNFDYAF